MSAIAKYCATDLCACCKNSAWWLWGRKDNVQIINNAIELNKYKFSIVNRERFREKYELGDSIVIGNVARFSEEKNHEFMLEILREAKKEYNIKLLLVGGGKLEDEIKEKAIAYGVSDSVIFLGVRKDVAEILNAMDVFILPSKYEGFPVTLVEAQANGLPIIASDVITDEVKLTDDFTYLSVAVSPNVWIDEILNKTKEVRGVTGKSVEQYDVDKEAVRLAFYYKKRLQKRIKRECEYERK